MTASHVTITGTVQGVWFRGWTKQQADALGVTGWVRNCADGSVEAHLEGEDRARAALIERLRSGPPDARVADVTVAPAPTTDCAGFEIRH